MRPFRRLQKPHCHVDVTLTDEDYIALSVTRKWPDFQRRITDLLVRHLQANGDAGLVIAAVEIGAKRFARTGRPDPHIHIVTTGWKTKDVTGSICFVRW